MKTREQIIDFMLVVITERMAHPCIKQFQSDALLVEDLALDSSLILQFLVHMELDYGLETPDEVLMKEDFKTVRDLVKILYEAQDLPRTEKGLEVYEDIKIHCVASCLSEIVKRNQKLDHRILYFAVWDAEICIDNKFVLTYHRQDISHSFLTEWYEKIYGMKVDSWYDDEKSKEENIRVLTSLVENRESGEHIMVMLDMFHLPERENEFNKNPFPHYLMLGPTSDPDLWMIYDPDFRWEGVISKDRILNAVAQPTVCGGFKFSDRFARPTPKAVIKEFIDASVVWNSNPVTDAIRAVVEGHITGIDKDGLPLDLAKLGKALEELPVVQPRKYGYEHGFAFFWRELLLPEAEFDQLCEDIDELAKGYKIVHLHAIKLASSSDASFIPKLMKLLEQQDLREFALKQRLREVYEQWLAVNVSEKALFELTEA